MLFHGIIPSKIVCLLSCLCCIYITEAYNMNIMMEEHYLREQNFQLKNEITDLKNAFDLNRDILKLLSVYNSKTDPHFNLLMQIITRLTSVNNQAMLNNIDLIHHKNALKQQNLKLNLDLNALDLRLQQQLDKNKQLLQPTESKLLMQQQFNALNRELLATNQERIFRQQELQFWKDKSKNLMNEEQWSQSEKEFLAMSGNMKRRYSSNKEFKYEALYRQLQKQNIRLKNHIQQLENRLMIFIKSHKLDQQNQNECQGPRESPIPFFEAEREEIRLLKYALNDIHIDRKEDECILTITTRFKPRDTAQQELRQKRSTSWPKNKGGQDEKDKPQRSGRLQMRQTDCY